MNIFDTAADVEQTKDLDISSVVHAPGLYPATVKTAYVQANKDTGSSSIVLILNVKPEDQEAFEYTTYECIISGTTKGDYYVKDGKKIQLMSKKRMNSLCELLVGTDLSGMFKAGGVEEKVHKVKRDGKEVNETLPTLTAWQGLELHIGLQKTLENKQVKQASGKYVATNETVERNNIDKFFDAQKRTNQEMTENKPAEYHAKWLAANSEVKDKTKKLADGISAGVPASAPAAPLKLDLNA